MKILKWRTFSWPQVSQMIQEKWMLRTSLLRTKISKTTRYSSIIAYLKRKNWKISSLLRSKTSKHRNQGTQEETEWVRLQTRIQHMTCNNNSSSIRYPNKLAWAKQPWRELLSQVEMLQERTRQRLPIQIKNQIRW